MEASNNLRIRLVSMSGEPDRILEGTTFCPLTQSTFQDLLKEASRNEQISIAHVVDSNGRERFYHGLKVCRWLRYSFTDPVTAAVVSCVRIYVFKQTLDKEVCTFNQIGNFCHPKTFLKSYQHHVPYLPLRDRIEYLRDSFKYNQNLIHARYHWDKCCEELNGVEINSENLEDLYLSAKVALRYGPVCNGISILQKILEVNPAHLRSRLALGKALSMSALTPEERYEALSHFERALEISPTNRKSLLGDAELNVNYEIIINYMKKAQEIEPCQETFERLINLLLEEDNEESINQAIELLKKALEEDPCDYFSFKKLHKIKRSFCEDITRSVENQLENILKNDPSHVRALMCLTINANPDDEDSNIKELVKYLKRALETDPECILALRLLGFICIHNVDKSWVDKSWDNELGIKYLQKAFYLYPGDEEVLRQLYIIYTKDLWVNGKPYDDVLKILSYLLTALEYNPNNNFALRKLYRMLVSDSCMYGLQENVHLVVQYLNKALISDPNDSYALVKLFELFLEGIVSEKTMRFRLKNALAKDPNDPIVLSLLSMELTILQQMIIYLIPKI